MQELTEIEKAQIAMAIDCDGFVGLHYNPRPGIRGSFSWVMGVNNKAPELVNYFHSILPLNSIIYNNHADKSGGYYGWFVRSASVIPLLELIGSYLIIKQPQVRLALEYKKTRLPENWRSLRNKAKKLRVIPEADWQLRFDIFHKMIVANSRYKYVSPKHDKQWHGKEHEEMLGNKNKKGVKL